MAYYNPLYIWVGFHPLYDLTNQGFFHCSVDLDGVFVGKKLPTAERFEVEMILDLTQF